MLLALTTLCNGTLAVCAVKPPSQTAVRDRPLISAYQEAPPLPLKLPPKHLFTCTVGRNRSQARCRRCSYLIVPFPDLPDSGPIGHRSCSLACHESMQFKPQLPYVARRGCLQNSAEVSTLLSKLANRRV